MKRLKLIAASFLVVLFLSSFTNENDLQMKFICKWNLFTNEITCERNSFTIEIHLQIKSFTNKIHLWMKINYAASAAAAAAARL